MARFFPLFSGSSGNSMYFGSGDGGILIDMGMSARKTVQTLQSAGIAPESLGGIFITHEHIDHIKGLFVFLKKYPVPVYASAGTCEALLAEGALPIGMTPQVLTKEGCMAAGILVQPFHTSHDCREGYGYTMQMPDGRTAALSTDLGYLSEEVMQAIAGKDLVVIESNHDVRMLQNGSYPYPLKRRILSDVGHLSNESCARALPELIRRGSTRFVLAHLSKENNLPQLALETSRAELSSLQFRENIDYSLTVAPRENQTGKISIF